MSLTAMHAGSAILYWYYPVHFLTHTCNDF